MKSCFEALILISFPDKLMRTRASKLVFIKIPLKNNPNVLKEYKGSFGVYYIQF